MFRRALIALLVCCGCLALGALPASATSLHPLTVMSFNMHHGVGVDDALDLRRTAAVVRNSGVDVVGLQEVDRHYSERSDWAGALGRILGYHVAFGANIDLDPPAAGRPRVQYGTAILSRYPISRAENTFLPTTPGEEQRGLLHAELDVHGLPVDIYDTHLGDKLAADRERQVERIGELLHGDRPTVLFGDLNAPPETPEIRTIAARLTDAWACSGLGRNGFTYPTEAPIKRIDYVFTDPATRPLLSRVVRTGASDHLPLLSYLLLNGR